MRYLILLRNDATGSAVMLQDLTVGCDAFGKNLKRYGGDLECLYAAAGRFDAVAIAEFAEPAGVLAFSLTATAQGQYAEALPLFSRDDVARAEEIARAAAATHSEEHAAAANTGGGLP